MTLENSQYPYSTPFCFGPPGFTTKQAAGMNYGPPHCCAPLPNGAPALLAPQLPGPLVLLLPLLSASATGRERWKGPDAQGHMITLPGCACCCSADTRACNTSNYPHPLNPNGDNTAIADQTSKPKSKANAVPCSCLIMALFIICACSRRQKSLYIKLLPTIHTASTSQVSPLPRGSRQLLLPWQRPSPGVR